MPACSGHVSVCYTSALIIAAAAAAVLPVIITDDDGVWWAKVMLHSPVGLYFSLSVQLGVSDNGGVGL